MTNCCRKSAKLMCEHRNEIENCKDCVSYVWLALQEIDKKLEEEDVRFWKDKIN